VHDGRLTGKVLGKIVDRAQKETIARALAAELEISMDNVVAVGDGANDLDMINAAGVGIAFNIRAQLNKIYSTHTGQPIETIETYMERDSYLDADEALEFGIVDAIMLIWPLVKKAQFSSSLHSIFTKEARLRPLHHRWDLLSGAVPGSKARKPCWLSLIPLRETRHFCWCTARKIICIWRSKFVFSTGL
jgi:hypothetical protein